MRQEVCNKKNKLRIGYIAKYSDPQDPNSHRFVFFEDSYTRRISGRGDRVYSKMFYPVDYDDVASNTDMMNEDGIILICEPFFLDEKLREKAARWVEWANNASPEEYDPFADAEQKESNGNNE